MAEEIFFQGITKKRKKKEIERKLWNNIVCRFSKYVFIVLIKFNSSIYNSYISLYYKVTTRYFSK